MSASAISSSASAATPATPAPAPATKAVSAAVAEATESPSQTLNEASGGDRQAQKLLHHGTVGTRINTKA